MPADFDHMFDEVQSCGVHQLRQLDSASRILSGHLSDEQPVPHLLALVHEIRACANLALAYSHYLLPLRHGPDMCAACAAEEDEGDC